MTFEIYTLGALALVIIILFIWVIWLQNKLGRLLAGKTRNLDESMALITNELAKLKKFRLDTENTFKNHDGRLKKAVSGVATIRFNPFKGDGSGGNQSFATAFMTEEKNGVVISSMYSRDHVSIFSKPIKNLASEQGELTNEEREAMNRAKDSIKTT